VRGVLADEEKIAEGWRARLGGITDRAFNIDVFSYIDTAEFDVQVAVRENLLFTIYQRLEAAGIRLAYPSQTVVFQGDGQGEVREDGQEGRDARSEGGERPRLEKEDRPGR